MENKIDNDDKNKIIDINDIESFLIESGYISQGVWTKQNSEWFDYNKVNEILLSFEFNEKIAATGASVNYGDKIQWINKIFKTDINLEELHSQYVHYTSTSISFVKLLNNFIMLELILKNFYTIINKNNKEDINTIFTNKIIMNNIDINSSLIDKNVVGLKQKLDSIFTKIKKNSNYNGKDANYKLIAIIFLLSMGSSFSVDKNIGQISNLMNYFVLYNKIYINDINISFILFLSLIICINLYIYCNKKKNHFKYIICDNKNAYNNFYQEFKKKEKNSKIKEQNDYKQNYISLYLFDNDIITYNGDYFFELLILQNYLKMLSIYHLSKNQIKLTVNLTIDTIIETLKSFSENVLINTNKNILKNSINTINENIMNKDSIKLSNILFLSKNNIIKCFSTFNFNELLLKVTNFQDENQIKAINTKYFELIQKTKKLYFQNSISTINQINQNTNVTNQFLTDIKNQETSLDYLIKEFNILLYLLNYFKKTKEAKKFLKFYCFKFRFFKCSVFRQGQKEMQIFFDYSSLKEKVLLKYLKDISNLLNLIKQYEKIFSMLYEFKFYNIMFRISQTTFRSRHLNFYFTLIINKLSIFLIENKCYRITIYDTKLDTYDETMMVYIKDDTIKTKSRINTLRDYFNQSIFNNKLKLFNDLLKDLAEDWDIIIIGEDIEYQNLIFFHNANILLINIVNEIIDNSVQKFIVSSSIIAKSINPFAFGNENTNQDKNKSNFEYINIMMYIKKDEEFADKSLKFAENIKNSKNSTILTRITFICERYFFEEKIVMNSRIKEDAKQIYENIDNFYLVCDKKKNEEIFKYDLYITKNMISIANHLNLEITNDFSKFIYSFISTMSSCIELILYILKNKETDPNKFFYLQNINKDYYYFEYKTKNIFIKKLKTFDSLLLFNPKKSIPLFCLLCEIQNNEDIDDIETFPDLFLRLFLNLNKVVEANNLNANCFEKIHKNIFFENYDNYKLMAFSYDSFFIFNDFFINNNYLEISKNKFEICYIMPYEVESALKVEKFKKLMEYKEIGKLIAKNIKIYDYALTTTFIFKNENELKMNYKKAEFFIKYHKNSNELQNSIKNKIIYVYKKLKNKKFAKKDIKKILTNIKELYYEKNCISYYIGNTSHLEKLLMEFNTEQVKIRTVKLTHKSLYI